MKKLTIITILMIPILWGQVIENVLQEKLDTSPSEMIPVIVTMKEHILVSEILDSTNLSQDNLRYRSNTALIIKNKAEESQFWLKSFCETRSFVIQDYQSFWISNMVSLKASAQAIREIAEQPEVENIFWDKEYIFVDYLVSEKQTRSTWGLEKIGSKSTNKSGNEGQGVLVAVIDTGVNYTHNHLKDRVILGYDFANNDNDPIDDNGHGTHCAGTIAGTSFGVAPQAKILAVKVMAKNGGGTWSNIARGVEYIASYNENGETVDIASMSLGGPSPIQQVLRDAFDNALAMGIRFAVAAGNSGHFKSTIDAPGDQKDVITVGATNFRNWIAPFSSRGPVIKYGDPYIKPDVVAPGVDVTSCWIGGDDATRTISGTSMATPHVAGTMALMLHKNPNISQKEILEILESTATDLGDEGKDNNFGSGLIYVPRALDQVAEDK